MKRFLSLMLWSMRISSSRQWVASAGDDSKQAIPPQLVSVVFGGGIRAFTRTFALGSTGTWLPGKGKPVIGFIGQSTKLPVDWLGHRSLKFPVRSAEDGTG